MKAITEVAVTLTDEPWNRLGADARTSATSIRAIEVRGRRHRKCRPPPALDAGVQAEPGNMAYFTNCGPKYGPFLLGDAPESLSVLEARDKPMPIGTATLAEWSIGGVTRWRLIVRGAKLSGLYTVVGREFTLWK